MGCCGSNVKYQTEIPFEKVEKYSKLKIKLEQFLSNENTKEKKDKKILSDLIIETLNEITEYELELDKLKKSKQQNINVSEELIEGISDDINKLKDYHIALKNLLTNCDKINNENINIDNDNKDDSSILSSDINNKKEKENIYFKKYIRRNKQGVLNKNKQRNKKNDIYIYNKYKGITHARLNFIKNYENIDENDNKNGILLTSENLPLDSKNEDLNLIFEIDGIKKTLLHAKPEEKFLDVIKRLREKDKNCDNIENLKFYDEDKDISDKIISGEIVKDFNLTDFHSIQVKFKDKNNLLES